MEKSLCILRWPSFRLFVFFGCLSLLLIGCSTVKTALDNYEACKGDAVCMEQMAEVKESSYLVSREAVRLMPFPSIPEGLAILASNIVAFGFGVLKGRKVKKT